MTMDAPRQLVLDLPHRPATGRDDFFISPANERAIDAIDLWPAWPHHALVLIGDAGSGKSHLAAVWQRVSSARQLDAASLSSADVASLSNGENLIVEQAGSGFADEAALFHALNLAREHGGSLLFTATSVPADWPVHLADLASRLRAVPTIRLSPPDDLLLRAVLGKLFADRQIAIDSHVIDYMAARMHRSLDAARKAVEAIDQLALVERRNVTRALVQRVLADMAQV